MLMGPSRYRILLFNGQNCSTLLIWPRKERKEFSSWDDTTSGEGEGIRGCISINNRSIVYNQFELRILLSDYIKTKQKIC